VLKIQFTKGDHTQVNSTRRIKIVRKYFIEFDTEGIAKVGSEKKS